MAIKVVNANNQILIPSPQNNYNLEPSLFGITVTTLIMLLSLSIFNKLKPKNKEINLTAYHTNLGARRTILLEVSENDQIKVSGGNKVNRIKILEEINSDLEEDYYKSIYDNLPSTLLEEAIESLNLCNYAVIVCDCGSNYIFKIKGKIIVFNYRKEQNLPEIIYKFNKCKLNDNFK